MRNCFGFVDGTLCRRAKPKNNQRVLYNGHKRVHAIKFQSVATPNGHQTIPNFAGPFEGRQHDSMMLHETRMLRRPQRVSWAQGQSLCLYSDPSYPLGVHLVQTAFRDAHLIPQRQLYNQAMSEVRVSVEWI